MKLNKLNIGVPLSKEEQKTIKGGSPCPIEMPNTICECGNGSNVNIGDGGNQPILTCEQLDVCGTSGVVGALCE